MAVGVHVYKPSTNDIVIVSSNWYTIGDYGGTYRGCIALRNRRSDSNGWKYDVYYGWKLLKGSTYFAMNVAYFTLSATIAGKSVSYTATNNVPGKTSTLKGTYVLLNRPIQNVVFPFGATVSGSANFVGHKLANPSHWKWGGAFSSSAVVYGSKTIPASPTPAVPTTYGFNTPTSIGATNATLTSYFDGNASQRSYYHMSMYNVTDGKYVNDPASGTTSGSRVTYNKNVTGLTAEKSYTMRMRLHNGSHTAVGTAINRTFKTLSYDKCYRKVNGTWTRGFAYLKRNGTWARGKQLYLKRNGTWTRSKAQ